MNQGETLPPPVQWPLPDHLGCVPPSPKPKPKPKTSEKRIYLPYSNNQNLEPWDLPPEVQWEQPHINQPQATSSTFLILQRGNPPPTNNNISPSAPITPSKDDIIHMQKQEIEALKKELQELKDELKFYNEEIDLFAIESGE